jgi:hypothetical protein
MFIKIMDVVNEQCDALLKKADRQPISRTDIVCVFNTIRAQVRAAERNLIETVAEQVIRAKHA